jgi:hypothetical protein
MLVEGREVVVSAENMMAQGLEEIAVDRVNRMAARSATTRMIAECIWCC